MSEYRHKWIPPKLAIIKGISTVILTYEYKGGQGIKLIIPAESHNSHTFQIMPIQNILWKVPNKKHGGRLMMMVGAYEPVK